MSYVNLKNIVGEGSDREQRATVDYVDNSAKNTFEILNAANKLGEGFKTNISQIA